MMALVLALSFAAAPPSPAFGGPPVPAISAMPTAAQDEEDRWVLLRSRQWMARVGLGSGSGWDGDVAAGIRDAAPLSPTDPLVRELEPLLRRVASEAPPGLAPAREPGPIPDPGWTLAWRDVDGDGRQEIVVAGGTSPAPFYAVIQRAEPDGRSSWRILHQAPFRFLGASTHAGHLFLFGAFDGYGVAGAALAVDRVDASNAGPASSGQVLFELPGWEAGPLAAEPTIVGCTTARRTKLRAAPRRDDMPREDGLGGHLPGNLLQTIEKGSTGWSLDSAKGPGGQRWTLCFFVGSSPMESERPEKAMSRPLKAKRAPLAAGGRVLVGWVPSADLLGQ
ncbi:MAG TPA: hypothetical protein VLT47_08895 [Anaeromyxobacteraceae bacterium]|nr:hypothetical protein [Anaeromyxobacteraceae bacterium]